MNYVPNQNEKVLEERLAGFNSDDVKITLRRLRCFKIILPLLQVLQKCHLIPVTLVIKCQTSNNSVIHIRWWQYPLPSGPSLALTHPNSWLETYFVLWLAKIIEYTVFQLSLSNWFVCSLKLLDSIQKILVI